MTLRLLDLLYSHAIETVAENAGRRQSSNELRLALVHTTRHSEWGASHHTDTLTLAPKIATEMNGLDGDR